MIASFAAKSRADPKPSAFYQLDTVPLKRIAEPSPKICDPKHCT